ncbi:type II toxin-antitoxin system VapC family toxin [Caballeronia sp. ATUFL_M1_KS5A]|uniref:type II toxin-antitoxin system VapC family toxin n=1 Tax=Caballeronia sp. ATUFL_M1_KS5A TaxID=2921778 RepID=UPI0020287F71|nr:type II toxin-antitoxin system VapC family toxin [Caballeronia sp. ATUFL_M1_KS5A]
MRVLLDTPIYLWVLQDDPQLSHIARGLKTETDEIFFVSSGSIWEASIKAGLGKLNADPKMLVAEIEGSGFRELPVLGKQAMLVHDLPDIYRDPFDRLLVAQAMSEPLILLTADGHLSAYSKLVTTV